MVEVAVQAGPFHLRTRIAQELDAHEVVELLVRLLVGGGALAVHIADRRDHALHLTPGGDGLPASLPRRMGVLAAPARRERAAVVLVGLHDAAPARGESARHLVVPPPVRPFLAAAHRRHRAAFQPAEARHAFPQLAVAVDAGVRRRLAREIRPPVVVERSVRPLPVGEGPVVPARPGEDVDVLGGEVVDERGERRVRRMAGEVGMDPGVEVLPAPRRRHERRARREAPPAVLHPPADGVRLVEPLPREERERGRVGHPLRQVLPLRRGHLAEVRVARPVAVELRAVVPGDGIRVRAARRRDREVVVQAQGPDVVVEPLPAEQDAVAFLARDVEGLHVALVVFGGEVEQRVRVPPERRLDGEVPRLGAVLDRAVDAAPRGAREQAVVRRRRPDPVREAQARVLRGNDGPAVRRHERNPEAHLRVPRRRPHRAFDARDLSAQVLPHEAHAVRKRLVAEARRLRGGDVLRGMEVLRTRQAQGEQVGAAVWRGKLHAVRRAQSRHAPVRGVDLDRH